MSVILRLCPKSPLIYHVIVSPVQDNLSLGLSSCLECTLRLNSHSRTVWRFHFPLWALVFSQASRGGGESVLPGEVAAMRRQRLVKVKKRGVGGGGD